LDFKFVVLTSLSAFHKISTSSIRFQVVRLRLTIILSPVLFTISIRFQEGIKFKSILLIPTLVSKTKNTVSSIENTYPENHSVLSKETLYGIARQYGLPLKT
jgi:LysM repeat protein